MPERNPDLKKNSWAGLTEGKPGCTETTQKSTGRISKVQIRGAKARAKSWTLWLWEPACIANTQAAMSLYSICTSSTWRYSMKKSYFRILKAAVEPPSYVPFYFHSCLRLQVVSRNESIFLSRPDWSPPWEYYSQLLLDQWWKRSQLI